MKKTVQLIIAIVLTLGFNSCGNSNESKSLDLNVMSFNVRVDVASDSLNAWKYRKDVAAQIVLDYDVDILGTQEPRPNQMEDLRQSLKGYTSIGVGREDGANKGEFSALFYKTDRFKEISSGTFWLSETPEVPGSMGWDAAYPRVATWAVLEDIATKIQFFAVNTHLDHMGKEARIKGVTMMLNRAHDAGKDLPVILTGDFNSTPNSDVVQHITAETTANNLVSSRTIAKEKKDKEYTFHDFGRLALEKRQYIDYIFVSKSTEVSLYEVIDEKLNDIYLSDHNPLFAKISIK